MVVASGQMPYNYGTNLPIRAKPNAWPGSGIPNISASGDIVEAAMFVYNAELRKWNESDLSNLTYLLYSHPDITPSGFEPKANGDTLTGKVGGRVSIMSVDNIEQLRRLLDIFLFEAYADDSEYSAEDFLESWLTAAFPESPSGGIVITALFPGYSLTNRTFLRPSADHVVGGDFVDTDIHWLGGSGVLFDIDYGEVIFNPFPFPGQTQYFAPSTGNHRFNFGPIIPTIQTTAGSIPSVDANRYETDIGAGSFRATTNFQALGSGYVQIDGYALLPSSVIELVKGNDNNFDATLEFENDYTDHIQGLRRVRAFTGKNDPSARCYRLPTPQSSGLYRLITYNPKDLVPSTAIASGFVSLVPPGRVIKADDGTFILTNRIDGQQYSELSDGTTSISPASAEGVHVLDDAIWITSPNSKTPGSGSFASAGLFVLSPYNGDLVWYRPAERVLSTSGNFGPGPAIFGAHVGLMDLGTNFVRVSKTALQISEQNISGDEDKSTFTVYFQLYDKTTLDHVAEVPVGYAIQSEDANQALFNGFTGLHGAISDGSNVYIWAEFGAVHKFTTGLSFVNAYDSSVIARRRHYANGQLLYTSGGNFFVGDPLLLPGGGVSSGIGVWSLTDPAGTSVDGVGIINHDSAKTIRGEAHFGDQAIASIHSIFDVVGSTHVTDGTWMIIQFGTQLYLARIVEQPTYWEVVESIRFRDSFGSVLFGDVPEEFPIEGILHDID